VVCDKNTTIAVADPIAVPDPQITRSNSQTLQISAWWLDLYIVGLQPYFDASAGDAMRRHPESEER
jgi:hypothetical protein